MHKAVEEYMLHETNWIQIIILDETLNDLALSLFDDWVSRIAHTTSFYDRRPGNDRSILYGFAGSTWD